MRILALLGRHPVLGAVGVFLAMAATTAGLVFAASGEKRPTSCQAAEEAIGRVRREWPSTVAYVEWPEGVPRATKFREIAAGRMAGVRGEPSADVASRLRGVADDLAALASPAEDEFTVGRTGRDMDGVLAACAAERR